MQLFLSKRQFFSGSVSLALVKVLFTCVLFFPGIANANCVVLLHGLARTADSMQPMADWLAENGYQAVNIDYPSREQPIELLAPAVIEEGLTGCDPGDPAHFVTHSMGGILVRYYAEHVGNGRIGRVVMLAPPNRGSEVVDSYRDIPGFEWLNGPAGMQLGTDESSVPRSLGAVAFELGVIAGSETFNPVLSQSLPNPDDGKVSVESTKVAGMQDFLVVPHSHPFIMQADVVLEQTLHFLAHGRFQHSPAQQPLD